MGYGSGLGTLSALIGVFTFILGIVLIVAQLKMFTIADEIKRIRKLLEAHTANQGKVPPQE